MNLSRRMIEIAEAILESQSLSEDQRAYLKNAICPEWDFAQKRATFDDCGPLWRQASEMLPTDWKISPRARLIRERLVRYRDRLWLGGGERTLDKCPPQYLGKMIGLFWEILKRHDAVPSERSLRRILADSPGNGQKIRL